MDLRITHEPTEINWHDICDLLRRGELGERDPHIAQLVFCGSYASVFAWDGVRLIGAARAISDGIASSAIYDVVVDPDYQGQGIGSLLMQTLLARLPKRSIMLVSVKGKEPFYRKLGFRRLSTAYMLKDDFKSWETSGYFDDES